MATKLHLDNFQLSWLYCSLIIIVHIALTESNNCPLFFNQSNRTDTEITVTESNLQQCDLFNNLVDILEKLNILISSDASCYSLQKVTQSFGIKETNSQIVKISFQFQENFKRVVTGKSSGDPPSTSMCPDGNVLFKAPYQGRQSGSFVKSTNQTENKNDTVALATSTNDDDSSVLSHTQVVVIATCSAVIGTFFILAAALRIRNYMKRLREEQQEARRSNNYRLPLSKASISFEGHSRKSSMSSKDSQQPSRQRW